MGALIGSRTVDWWPVHLFVVPVLQEVGSWPLVGSLTWQRLAQDDPAKLAAILDAGRHWALRVDTCQATLAQASHDISAAADWSATARRVHRGRGSAYIPRKAS